MASGQTIFRSPLEKPLGQLTEDDIAQLTREDCRRFLKEKGMRRPSWNKSQAIEQVISLKSLLEPTPPESNTGEVLRQERHQNSQPGNPVQQVSSTNIDPSGEKATRSTDFQISVSVQESVPYRRKDPPKPAISGDSPCRTPISSDNNTNSPRTTHATNGTVGQMTIFYCGKVSVYDGMPAEKARLIMQLAASPMDLSQDPQPSAAPAVRPFACRLLAASARFGLPSSPSMQNVTENSRQYREEGTPSREAEPEGPISRKASLQRYLEKRKDRGKLKIKKKVDSSSPSSLEIYLNHQMRGQHPNEQSSPSGTCSPPQLRPPHTPTNSLEKQISDTGLSVDLNNNDA